MRDNFARIENVLVRGLYRAAQSTALTRRLGRYYATTFNWSLSVAPLHRIGLDAEGNREAPMAASDISRPNDPASWERVYLAPIVPVSRLSSPIAHAITGHTRPGEILLEAGCGSATLSAELATTGRIVELCDFSQAILDRASELFRVSQLTEPRTTLCDLTRPLPWKEGAVDTVWSSGVLEHWTDEELVSIVSEMARISSKRVISLVPNARCVFYRMGKDLAEHAGRWPYGREIPRQTLRPVFEAAGLCSVQEYTLWSEMASWFLGLTDARLRRLVRAWWASLSHDDPVKADQGYLLLTVGHKSNCPS